MNLGIRSTSRLVDRIVDDYSTNEIVDSGSTSGNPEDLSATSQRPIFTKFGHETYFGVPSRNPERHFWKIFTLGVICPLNLKSKICETGTSLRAGYRSGAALQYKGQGVSKIGQLFYRTYGCRATGRQNCPIFVFWPEGLYIGE